MIEQKRTFGQFLTYCRVQKGLTQKQLGDLLYVGESAISKWEKDKRRPDLELVSSLSEILGVTETELIRACVDKSRLKDKKLARQYIIIVNIYNLVNIIGMAIAFLTCLIVNLAVSGKLDWFFIVLTGLLSYASFMLVPQYIKCHKLLLTTAMDLLSVILLVGMICIVTKSAWFFIAFISLILAYSIIFVPMLIDKYKLPAWIKKYKLYIAVSLDFILTFILLIAIDVLTHSSGFNFGWSVTLGLPIMLFWTTAFLITIFIAKHLRLQQFTKISVLIFAWLVIINSFFPFQMMLGIENEGDMFWSANLAKWSSSSDISNNIMLLVNIAILLTAIIFMIIGYSKSRKH